ncbi:hypothetical protein MTR_3g089640 [Medicago truncatula]|uniref:Uncharacterized protein n=1 Tax=Medicago truncatula TaxID=3880 RepID=G7J5L8_MEDTR|nr:hypothetical protein MTR_3g089640 [Medicago truncatula]
MCNYGFLMAYSTENKVDEKHDFVMTQQGDMMLMEDEHLTYYKVANDLIFERWLVAMGSYKESMYANHIWILVISSK